MLAILIFGAFMWWNLAKQLSAIQSQNARILYELTKDKYK